jgi:hypothetical protein
VQRFRIFYRGCKPTVTLYIGIGSIYQSGRSITFTALQMDPAGHGRPFSPTDSGSVSCRSSGCLAGAPGFFHGCNRFSLKVDITVRLGLNFGSWNE